MAIYVCMYMYVCICMYVYVCMYMFVKILGRTQSIKAFQGKHNQGHLSRSHYYKPLNDS